MSGKTVVFFDGTPLWSGGANRILFLAREIRKRGFAPKIVCLPSGRLGALAEADGIETLKISPFSDLDPAAFLKIFSYLRRSAAAVVDLNSPVFYWTGLAAARLAGAKVILTRNVPYRKRGLKRVLNGFFLYRRCDRVLSLSAAVKKDIEGDYGAKNTALIYDGIFSDVRPPSEGEAASAKKKFGFSPSDTVFGLVGRLEKNKGQSVAVEAFARAAGDLPSARLLVAGGGSDSYAASLASLVRDKGLSSKIVLAGYVDDVSAVYAASDIIVHPSFYDNIPISILEAFASARPVIASRVGGIPEIVAEGVNGSLFEAGDVSALSECMKKTAASDYKSLGRRAAALAAERFSPVRMADNYTLLLDDVLGKKK